MARKGDRGPLVHALRRFLLNDAEHRDYFDASLDEAVRRWQRGAGLRADGIVGPKTRKRLIEDGFLMPPTPSEQEVADACKVPVELVRALEWTEGGSPQSIGFEPHKFLDERPDLEGLIPYTPGKGVRWSQRRDERGREAFDRAFALDPAAAVRATSWGSYQVLGGHLLDLAGGDPVEAVKRWSKAPESTSHRLLTAWLLDGPRAVAAAQAERWVRFAELYNGPQQARHRYADRLVANLHLVRKEMCR